MLSLWKPAEKINGKLNEGQPGEEELLELRWLGLTTAAAHHTKVGVIL